MCVPVNHMVEAATDKVFCKKGFLKNFAIFTGKHLCWSLFVTIVQTFRPATLLKRDSNTWFADEIWEIFKNTYFEQHLFSTSIIIDFVENRKKVKNRWLLSAKSSIVDFDIWKSPEYATESLGHHNIFSELPLNHWVTTTFFLNLS